MPRKATIPLDAEPEIAAALGRLIGHWAICEHEIEGILGYLLRIDDHRARYVWEAFIGFSAKNELVMKLNHHFTDDKSQKDSLHKLLKQANKLNDIRNNHIHAIWAAGGKKKLTRLKKTRSPYTVEHSEFTTFTGQDILNDVEQISVLSAALQEWRLKAQFGPLGWPPK